MKLIEWVISREQESLSAAYIAFWMLTGCFCEIPGGRETSAASFPLFSVSCIELFSRLWVWTPVRLAGGSVLSPFCSSLSLRLLFDDIVIAIGTSSAVAGPIPSATVPELVPSIGANEQQELLGRRELTGVIGKVLWHIPKLGAIVERNIRCFFDESLQVCSISLFLITVPRQPRDLHFYRRANVPP